MKFTINGKEYRIFSWPQPVVKWVISLFVILFLTFIIVEECDGADLEIGGGVAVARSLDPLQATAGALRVGGLFYDRLELVGRYYGDQDWSDDYWAVSVGYRASIRRWAVKPYLSLGIAYAEENTILSQEFNFNLAGGLKWKFLLFEIHHFSNAGLEEPNTGQNDYTLSFIKEF